MNLLGQPGMSPAKLEAFVNDYLRVDLARYEQHINTLNADIMEYVQLKNMIESIASDLSGGAFKTQVNVGGNCFVQARVPDTRHILVNVGLQHYVEFTLDEALQFCQLKVRALNKQADVLREESIKTRANIKLALMCLNGGEQTQQS